MIRKPEIMLLEESLHRRLGKYAFSEDYHYVQYGYDGEQMFKEKFPLSLSYIQLFNICLKHHQHHFEVDRMIITGESIYAFDVKSYHRTFHNEGGVWRKEGKSIKSPMGQYEQMKEGMQALMHYMGTHHNIVCKMIFIQPSFSIDQREADIVFFKEIKDIMCGIKNEKSVGKLEMEMKQYFEQIQKPISLYKQRPIFNMKDVTPGILCDVCGMKIGLGKGNGMYTKCSCCETRKSKEEWIRFALQEYQILVNRPINYTESVRWIGRAHRNLVKKVLEKHFNCTNGMYLFKT